MNNKTIDLNVNLKFKAFAKASIVLHITNLGSETIELSPRTIGSQTSLPGEVSVIKPEFIIISPEVNVVTQKNNHDELVNRVLLPDETITSEIDLTSIFDFNIFSLYTVQYKGEISLLNGSVTPIYSNVSSFYHH